MNTLPAACLVCNSTAIAETVTVHELQLGLGDAFHYQRCGQCGSLQLQNPPADFSKYYPNDVYYSFNRELDVTKKAGIVKKIKTEYLLFQKHQLLGKLLTVGYKMNEQLEWLKYTNAFYTNAILDVGTGNGSLLASYAQMGFQNLTGIDPFINESKVYAGLSILKTDLFELNGLYDVIMLHHSLEHMPNPQAALQRVYQLLKPGGRALVRVPVMGNYGWKTYGSFWCGIDAPRHLFIPSENGLKSLAQSAGFQVTKFYYDSFDYVIWCSEQYKHGIALQAANSQAVNPSKSMFRKKDLKQFRAHMTAENKKQNGDMAALYLVKPR